MSPKRSFRSSTGLVSLALLLIGAITLGSRAGVAAGTGRESLPPYHSANPIQEPKLFGDNFLATQDFESHPAFTPDAHTLYYVKSTPDFVFHSILQTNFVDGVWSVPTVVPFSGRYIDTDPFVTHDGTKLFYCSNHSLKEFVGNPASDNMDIWMVERVADGSWSEPKNLGPPVNSPGNESFPTVAADGTLYFGSDRPGGRGGADLYRCRLVNGTYGPAENLGDSVNTGASEIEPWIAPDQSYLLFTAGGRKDSRGGTDLYVSYARGKNWSSPVNLGDAVNSKRNEYSPVVSPDGEYFFWTSCRSFAEELKDWARPYPDLLVHIRRPENGLGDIYQIDLSALGIGK